jgi:FlaA1/EpsC-like NDP-sugar epimerase
MAIGERMRCGAIRHAIIFAVDAASVVVALEAALLLSFGGAVPARHLAVFPLAATVAVAARLTCNAAARLHAWSFRLAGLPDAVRLAAAAVAGSLLFGETVELLVPGGLPASAYALEFFLSASAFTALRFGPRVALRWYGARTRRKGGAAATIVVGVTSQAELLARDIARNPESRYDVIGFVGTDPSAIGRRLDGTPILGVLRDLPTLIARHDVTMVLLALPRHPAARIREVIATCATCRVRFKILPASFSADAEVVSAALDDVAPEDLLPRPSVAFDEGEIRGLVQGRRALVTGAGGSIGGEMCTQLVRYGVRQLVMVDLNENELYLRARRLAEEGHGVEIHAEVADVRDPARLERLGERYRPEYVFHAAAHKHVPLMEDAPEEAIKNNVFGTLHVARMADSCGAERFVLISTDKAVNPTSVMGATKRVAELVLRHLARGSRTKMSAVRFGNVLGSAGSVVPLFKQQIARGGPVTVTHPDCTRYFMTIPEAVGLVLVAGLGGYGDLCVLDMGEPIRIDDLARIMVALAGRVPGQDIDVVYTGLRPGEKLAEELLTEDEEQTQAVRARIRIARSPAPPPDLELRLAELRRLADLGERDGILRVLKALVPTYRAHDPAALPASRSAGEARPHVAAPEGERQAVSYAAAAPPATSAAPA